MASNTLSLSTFRAKGLTAVNAAVDTSSLLYLKSTSMTAADLGNTVSLSLNAASISGAAHTNHSVFLNIGVGSGIGTPFQLQIPDSSVMYIYKRYYSSGAWSGWTKLKAGVADSADTWTTARTLTIGGTGKSVDGSGNVSWSKDEILGASDSSKFLRGDKSWSNTLTGPLYIYKETTDWKTGAVLNFQTKMSDTQGYSYIASYQTPTPTTYNDSLVIVATGGCFIGGGEGAETIHQQIMSGSGSEDLYLCPDGSIQIYTGADSKTHRATIDSTPSFYPATTNTGNIGTSSYKWANMYATTFNGNLSGDATGLSKLSNADAAALNAWRGGGIAQRNAPGLDDFVSSGLAKNDGIFINIPWSAAFGQQIYIDDNSWRIAHRYLNGVPDSGVPNWSSWKMIVSSTGNAAQGSATQPVYVDANGQVQTCTAYGSASVNYATSSGSCSGNAATATDADKLDGRHGTGYMRSNGNDTNLGQNSPAATVKTYFLNTDKVPNSNMTAVYCNSGTEYAHIFSRTGNWGSVIRWTYSNKYMWILRYNSGAWQSDDFEKMSAGYADTCGDADTLDGKHASAFLTSHQSLSNYVTLDGNQTITGTKTFHKRIIAYAYKQSSALPFITFDKPGSYATGIGPDGTSNRIHFGPCDLEGTAWTATSSFNSNEWHFQGTVTATVAVKNAVWNDLAEYRKCDKREAGYAIGPSGSRTTNRLEPGARIISDTWGFLLGDENKEDQAPIAIAGRVLTYPYKDKSNYNIGDAVCSAPGGTIDVMTREEIKEYPDRIIGIVNEIPDYDIWEPSAKGGGREPVHTNGRIWIDIK